MNEDILKTFGFDEELEKIKKGKCPFCNKIINPDTEFRDEQSKKEYQISKLCQKCQDEI